MGIRALTLHRPWDRLVLFYGKDVENRVWPTTLRGEFLVHAGKTYDAAGSETAAKVLKDHGPWAVDDGVTGIRGVVTLWAVCALSVHSLHELTCDCGPWAMPGQYHFRLRHPRPFVEPVPTGGLQRFWIPSTDLVGAIASALNDAEQPA